MITFGRKRENLFRKNALLQSERRLVPNLYQAKRQAIAQNSTFWSISYLYLYCNWVALHINLKSECIFWNSVCFAQDYSKFCNTYNDKTWRMETFFHEEMDHFFPVWILRSPIRYKELVLDQIFVELVWGWSETNVNFRAFFLPKELFYPNFGYKISTAIDLGTYLIYF